MPFTDTTGEVVEFLAIRTDITARKANEKILLDTARRLAEAQRISKTGSWDWDPETGKVYWSDEMHRIFGIAREDFDGSTEAAINAYHPEDRAYVEEATRRALREKKPQPLEARILLGDGSVRYVRSHAEAEYDAEGNMVRMQGTYQDTTERHEMELALRESRESYQRLFEQTGECLFIADQQGRFLDMNNAAVQLTAYSREELLAMNVRDLFEYSGEEGPRFAELLSAGLLTVERIMLKKNGDRIQTEIRARLLSDGRFFAAIRDLTAQRQLEQSLLQAHKLESLAVLAGGISHDFNNMLSGMFGYAELAKKLSTDPRITHYLQRILEGLERSQSLTHRLMTFASGGQPQRVTGYLFPYVRDTVTFVLSGSNCRAHFDIAADIHPCEYDPVQIAQVFDNLVRNAQQAMPGGGLISIMARNQQIREGDRMLLPAGSYTRVSVADTGSGIPEENLGRLFDPFFSTKPDGHGLGLASSYSIVKRHGGLLEVFSTPGKGSVFHVWLPASPDAVITGKTARAAEEPPRNDAGTILIMDDEEMVRESLSDLLQSLRYQVVAVAGGQAALDFHSRSLVQRRLPVAIILDLTIPGGMGGEAVVAEIRKRDRTTPVFVSSGYSAGAIMSDPASYGFTAALPKPVRLAELAALMEKYRIAR